jgi:membrane-associated phospholipid phosphatase
MPALRAAEWINLLGFSWSVVLALHRRALPEARRITITAISAAGRAVTISTGTLLPRLVTPLAAAICRDWIPCALLVMFYWQAGQFVTRADREFEMRLERIDRWLVVPSLEWCAFRPAGVWILAYLELAYMSYYVSLPGALAVLYGCGRSRDTDHFWTTVLLAAYAACGTLPFVQTRPPRIIGEKWNVPLPLTKVRALNLWILHRGSVKANTCPSAHVAIAVACAFALLRVGPVLVGAVFLLIAISIGLGAVSGRYHYAVDAILGVLVGAAAFVIEMALAAMGVR